MLVWMHYTGCSPSSIKSWLEDSRGPQYQHCGSLTRSYLPIVWQRPAYVLLIEEPTPQTTFHRVTAALSAYTSFQRCKTHDYSFRRLVTSSLPPLSFLCSPLYRQCHTRAPSESRPITPSAKTPRDQRRIDASQVVPASILED